MEKSLETTLENVHWIGEKTGMNEDALRKKVIGVYNGTHPDSRVNFNDVKNI